jgi:hypothetical protein
MCYIPDSIAAHSSFQHSGLAAFTKPAIKSPCLRSHMFQIVARLVILLTKLDNLQ